MSSISPPLRPLRWVDSSEFTGLELIDQTQLPTELTHLQCDTVESVWHAIKRLSVRGAPAIGVAAAYGVIVALNEAGRETAWRTTVEKACDYLATSRPTAVNLFWALDRMIVGDMEVVPLLMEISSGFSAAAQQKHIELSCYTRTPIPCTVSTDSLRVRQILTNLIGNAVKFTDRGWVRVEASFIAVPVNRMQIDVIDTGVGIDGNDNEQIFDPFSQADSSVTREFGGTGLGLTISRQFAQMLGGDVKLISAKRGMRRRLARRASVSVGAPAFTAVVRRDSAESAFSRISRKRCRACS